MKKAERNKHQQGEIELLLLAGKQLGFWLFSTGPFSILALPGK